ncbi:hypothetical protein G3M48_009240 [Beauveria asiatica]|uniref:Uncharacterized protein n=1 Tax=Beauveria asiatica TaxID=1069075 RepID=A0AAW0S3D8_9HYPO
MEAAGPLLRGPCLLEQHVPDSQWQSARPLAWRSTSIHSPFSNSKQPTYGLLLTEQDRQCEDAESQATPNFPSPAAVPARADSEAAHHHRQPKQPARPVLRFPVAPPRPSSPFPFPTLVLITAFPQHPLSFAIITSSYGRITLLYTLISLLRLLTYIFLWFFCPCDSGINLSQVLSSLLHSWRFLVEFCIVAQLSPTTANSLDALHNPILELPLTASTCFSI